MDALTIDRGTPELRQKLLSGEAPTRRRIEGTGTPERVWRQWMPMWETPPVSLDELVPVGARVVVVAPHPDDEVLGCGGLLSLLATRLRAAAPGASTLAPFVAVIGVTDGDASHPGSTTWTPLHLAAQRRLERLRGLRHLGLRVPVHALALPDGRVRFHERRMVDALSRHLLPDDVVITTWRHDGHPDHDAVGRACADAARGAGATLLEMPVWTWHWARPGDPTVPWHRLRRLPLSGRALEDKWLALSEHRSQLMPDGERPPVLFPEAVDRLLRPAEFFFMPERPA
ncbi:PIG-L deacetylase family protein [Roseateles sp.]|uniref:PIG-L deacetylase family protein n=1 Tax=Roseateles sp. TaxID=1971397 RepID=UPI002F40B687